MINNVLNLTENYSTHRIEMGKQAEVEIVNVPVLFEKDLSKPVALKMKCSAVPVAIATGFTVMNMTGGVGLWDKLAPVLLPILYDAGRIIFYVNGAKAIYRMCGGDPKGAIRQFKDVAMGYALLIGLDGIMYFIETYVESMKEGLLDGTITGAVYVAQNVIHMIGGVL